MPKGNPKPVQTDGFRAHQWPKVPGFKTETKPLTIRFTAEVYDFLQQLPDRQQFVRDAVDAAIAEKRQSGTLQPELRDSDGESDEVQHGAD